LISQAGYWTSWFVLPGGLLAFWFLSTNVFHWFNESQLPPPIQVWNAVKEMYQSGDLIRDVSISVQRVFYGFFIGSALAIILGTVVGLWKMGERIFDPTLQGIRTVPSFAWVPFLLLWMGIDEPPKVTLIAIGTFFPVYLNLVSGIRNVDRKLVEVGRIFGLNQWQMVIRIFIPASLPSLVTGLRLGIGSSWLFLTAAELIASTRGLGYILTDGQSTGRVDLMLVSILFLALFGVISDFLMRLIEFPVKKWNDSFKAN
jgi:sulfonate transport system permease protein